MDKTQPTSPFQEAERLDFDAGFDPKAWAGQCPYDFDPHALRWAWMDGFSKGRIDGKMLNEITVRGGRH